MIDEFDGVVRYIDGRKQAEAIRQGLPAALAYLEDALLQAELAQDARGVFEVLPHLLRQRALMKDTDRARELASRYLDLTCDNTYLIFLTARGVYASLRDAPLALGYLKRAETCALKDVRDAESHYSVGTSIHDWLAIKRLELFVLADSDTDRGRAEEVLNVLTDMTDRFSVNDTYVLDALPLLISQGVITVDHIYLAERERADIRVRIAAEGGDDYDHRPGLKRIGRTIRRMRRSSGKQSETDEAVGR